MKPDELIRLARELGLGLLDEAPLSDARRGEDDDWLVERVRSVLSGRAGREEIVAAIAAARAGHHAVVSLAGPRGSSNRAVLCRSAEQRLVVLADAIDATRDESAFSECARIAHLEHRANIADAAASLAHEVANASAAIAGWARIAGTAGSGVSTERAVHLMGRAAEAAQQASQRLLRLARGEASDELTPTNVSEVAEDLIALLGVQAREANVRLTAEVFPDMWVRASTGTLFSILWNLAKNAIEATAERGSVHVSLTGSSDTVVLRISDQGPGLSPEACERIFDKYVSTKAQGTGLGLPMVRSTAESLGADVDLQSTPGVGSTFRVAFPRIAPAADPQGERTPPRESGTVWPRSESSGLSHLPAQLRTTPETVDAHAVRPCESAINPRLRTDDELAIDVLIVEDDDPLREMMATALGLRGARVTAVRNIHEARNVTGHFDIALIDLALDECRGDELLVSLRRRGIVSTAMLVTGSVQKPRIMAGGEPNDWLRKPFELSELVERIQRTLARSSMVDATVGRQVGA
jgi:signal transduction histidine kinase/ActR/RegA family two-component response regulator